MNILYLFIYSIRLIIYICTIIFWIFIGALQLFILALFFNRTQKVQSGVYI